jgi:uncharacterized protein YgiM (DUF1202 family)
MKTLALAIFLSLSFQCLLAQDSIWYVAAKNGLSLRTDPSLSGKVITKLPYGEKITIIEYVYDTSVIVLEGFESEWISVSANGKHGYVASAFLLSSPPPRNNVKTIKEYLDQVSKQVCSVKYGEWNENAEEKYDAKTRTLYKNGSVASTEEGYEWSSTGYVLPGYNIQNAFHLLRLIPEFGQFIKPGSVFPVKDQKKDGVEMKVFKGVTCPGRFKHCIDRIRFYSENDEMTELEIIELNGEAHIIYESGV